MRVLAATAATLVAMGASLAISTAASAANLVSNPGLETGSLSPWTCAGGLGSVVTTPVHGGTKALAGAANASNHAQCSQTVTVLPNTAYVLSAWVRGGGGYVYLGYTGGTETWNPNSANAWTQLSLNLTTGAGQTSLTINIHGWYGTGTYYADDFSLDGPGVPPSSPPASPSASPSKTASPSPSVSPSRSASPSPSVSVSPPPPGGKKILGYFVEWGIYGRNYHVKNIATSGSASKLNYINYAFGNVTNGQCTIGDAYADYDKAYDAATSVDGVADTWDAGALRGSFNQLRKLKKMYPNIKVLWSFGGWTWSGGFGQAAANPTAFANSCYNLIEDPRWADVFDGIDIDWEYPNACGLSCDSSGPAAFKNLMSALRTRFGSSYLVTAAITADGTAGGKIDAADYGGAAQYLNWYNVMSYDYFGAFNAQGPTAPHSPLTSYTGIPTPGFYTDAAIQKLKSKGVPSSKLLVGIGFYGRGWTGVTQAAPGGTATGAAPGTYEAGIEDYKVLKNSCPVTGTIAGTAYAKCGSNWWSYDTPSTINGKMSYANAQGLGGSFFWELSGDTTNGELITAMRNGLG
ncbi:glycosyl hydrolase family 18 protein [Catellatospora sp. KI3]|uniref:glycosyl hydrolase family 18 protein n=1 Tax=Catellatospora sp. KI3 TaxID=3041620 RepID=UPI002482EEAF|nr:glycosyl hydrolase family 18 protein [Catellatospora sp. KI3]MDI1465328.1 glycosyl hydrolase family 18 protein [Catellatospora sp. KI3]